MSNQTVIYVSFFLILFMFINSILKITGCDFTNIYIF